MKDIEDKLKHLSPEKRALLLKKLQERQKRASKDSPYPLRPDPNEYPLSPEQERLWFLQQLEPESAFYNVPAVLKITGPLQAAALAWAIEQVVQRHQILRAYFVQQDNQVEQRLAPQSAVQLDVEEVPPEEVTEEALNERIAALIHQPFDLSAPPLFRVRLFRRTATEHFLVMVFHHIVTDGWSIQILVEELSTFYLRKLNDPAARVESLPFQFFDFAYQRRQWLHSDQLEKELAFWKQYLNGMPPVLDLPADLTTPVEQHFKGKRIFFRIPQSIHHALLHLAGEMSASPFMVYLAATQAFLFRLTQQEDFGIGIPVNLRSNVHLEKLMGFFVNTLVVRSAVAPTKNFVDLLQNIKSSVLEVHAHQDIPFDRIVDDLQPHRAANQTPLFNVMFDYQTNVFHHLELGDLHIEKIEPEIQTAKFDLLVTLQESEGWLTGIFEFNSERFRESTIQYWIQLFLEFLKNIAVNPHQSIVQVPLLPEREKQKLLQLGKGTPLQLPQDATFPSLFEKQVEEQPEWPAVVFQDQTLTYRQLNARANQLAHRLQQLGVGTEQIVGIAVPRSIEMVVAIVGTLKAGAAYLPLDPDYPEKRLTFILEDAQPRALITLKQFAERFAQYGGPVIVLDEMAQ